MIINFNKLPQNSGIPENWAYQHYLDIKQPMDGRSIRMKSIFGSDKTPSMFLYVKNGKYCWKDFSSGKSGDNPFSLIKEKILFETSQEVPYRKIMGEAIKTYASWCEKYGEFKEEPLETHYFLYDLNCNYTTRPFELHDLKYWNAFNVTERLLEEYNVIPLRDFQLRKDLKEFPATKFYPKYSTDHSYGFFSRNGDLIKIYNPFDTDFKHVSLKREILGMDQLKNTSQTLVIMSSMKDLLALVSLELSLEAVSAVSETVMINNSDMNYLKELYDNIYTLFDNDKAGIKAMLMYKQVYDLDFLYIPYYKDLAEFVNKDDYIYAKHVVAIAINKKLNRDKNIDKKLIDYEKLRRDVEKLESRHPY